MIRRIDIPETEIGEELGHGAHSVVYRGRHRDAPCAVKLPRSKGRWTRWVYREAVALARVRHPSLPAVLEVGEIDDLPYLVMELVEGETLADRLKRGPLDEGSVARVLDLAEHLVDALAAVHAAGLVHRDVKPRNIILERGGRVRLVDFGFAAPMDRTENIDDVAGTPGYASPEQFRNPSRVDGRSDLFSLGRVLSECLATRHDRLGANWTSPMMEICAGLLANDADDRYPDAPSVAAELALIRANKPLRGPRAYEPSRYVAPLVGRDAELQRLSSAWAAVGASTGVVAIVRGRRGSGKSRLLAGAVTSARKREGATIVEVQCRDGDPPLSALRRIFEAFVEPGGRTSSKVRDERAEVLRASVSDHLGAFATLIAPSLASVLGERAAVPDAEPEAFAEGATEILLRLARRSGRLLIAVDDLHWIDPVSRDVLARFAYRLPEAPGMLLVGTRGDEGTLFASGLPDELSRGISMMIDLEGFGVSQISSLVAAHLNDLAVHAALVRRISALADGTPLGVLEVLGAFLDVGALRPHARTWLFDAARAENVSLPDGAMALLGHRAAEVPLATRRVLEAAAILGTTFSEDLLARVVEVERDDLEYALADARRAGLIERSRKDAHSFVHDSLREMLAASLELAERRRLHQRVAEILDELGDESLEGLCAKALHFHAGDLTRTPERAYRAARAAANAALERFDNETALRFLDLARTAAVEAGLVVDAKLLRSLGEAQLRVGALEQSLASLEGALSSSGDREERAVLLGRIAWVHQASGEPERAWAALSRAFAALSASMPTDTAVSAAQTFGHLAQGQIRKLTRPPPLAEAESRAVDLLCALHYQNSRLGLEYGKPLRLIQSALEARRLSQRLGESRALARGSAIYGVVLYAIGQTTAGRRELESAQRISIDLADPVTRTFCLQMEAMAMGLSGRFDESIALVRQCLDVHGHWLELNEYLQHAASADFMESLRGHSSEAWEAISRASERMRRSQRKPTAVGAHIIHRVRAALAALGRVVSEDPWLARQFATISSNGGAPKGLYHLVSWGPRVRFFVESGDLGPEFDDLVRAFEREQHKPGSAHIMLSEYYVAVVHGRIHQCLRAGPKQRAPHVSALRRATADLRAAAKIPLLKAHRLLAEGHLAWFDGSTRKALRLFAQAQGVADQESCSWVLYALARARAHMLLEQGRGDAARDEGRVAEMLAHAHGAEPRARWIREELSVPGILSVPPPALSTRSSVSSASRRVRRQLGSLLHIVGAPHAGLRPAQQATTILDALLRDFDAENGLLWFQPDPSASAGLLIGRARGGRRWSDADGRHDALVRSVHSAGQTGSGEVVGIGDPARSLSFPLFLYDDAVGAICLERRAGQVPFSREDRELLELLSHQVPIALEIARLLVERARLQASLQQVQKMEAVGELAGGVAHDFNNMLMVVKASLDTLSTHTELEPEITDELSVISQAADRATQLTRRLLSFSRHQPVSLIAVDVNVAIRELEPMLRRVVAERAHVELRLGEDAQPIHGDRAAFEQALVNLVVNARDAMPDGGKVTISTMPAVVDEETARQGGPKAGSYTAIEVADNGQGMPADVLSRVFDPFFTTKPQGGGTGLGLTMVFAFAKNGGGRVTVDSEVGRGTTFRLYLPLSRTTLSGTSESIATGPAKPKTTRVYRDDMAILVVDDDQQVRESIRRVLHRAGYRVLMAGSGPEALQVVARLGPQISLVVLDVMMPGMTGPEVARRLAELQISAKILFVSGFAPSNLPVDMAEVSTEMLLQKPFASAELLDRVALLVGH